MVLAIVSGAVPVATSLSKVSALISNDPASHAAVNALVPSFNIKSSKSCVGEAASVPNITSMLSCNWFISDAELASVVDRVGTCE